MEKDNQIFLGHIMDCIDKIEKYVAEMSEQDFGENFLVIDAVVRNLEIIGEASKNISQDFKDMTLYIPWKKITGMRDNLIHEYFGVDKAEVWKTIKEDIPELKKEIKMLIK